MAENQFAYFILRDDHMTDLSYLFWESFHKRRTPEYLQQKYDTEYLGDEKIASIAYDGEQVVACYGAIPQRFHDQKSSFLVAHACDSFTIPTYQRRGLHYHSARFAYDQMRAKGVKMVYAFHSENTLMSTHKLGWKVHHTMQRFHLKTGIPPFSKAITKVGFGEWLAKGVKKNLAAYQCAPFPNPLKEEGFVCHQYDDDFFCYKNGFHEHFHISLESCRFYLKFDRILHVGYFDFPNEVQLGRALQHLKQIARRSGINEVLFQADPVTEQHRVLKAFLPAQDSWPIGYLCFDEHFDINQTAFNYADLDTF